MIDARGAVVSPILSQQRGKTSAGRRGGGTAAAPDRRRRGQPGHNVSFRFCSRKMMTVSAAIRTSDIAQ
jgi:hypothetical protein